MSRLPKTVIRAVILALLWGAACAPRSNPGGADLAEESGAAEPDKSGPVEEGAGTEVAAGRPSEQVVMRMGEESVTFGDLERALRRRALLEGLSVAELAPASSWRDPYFLGRMADAVLQERRLIVEGERLGLLPDADELATAWSAHPRLSELSAPGFERDVHQLLRAEIVHERWIGLVIERLEERTIWEEYRYRHDTVTVEAVAVPNVPSREELAVLLADPMVQSDIDRVYEAHPQRFVVPETVDARIVRVRVGADSPEADWESARQRAERLREEVLAGGDMVVMSRDRSDDTAAERGGLLEGLVERQSADVFAQVAGEIGPLRRDDWGWAFYRVESRHPRQLRPLDELLRREIATARLVRSRILSSAAERAARVLEALRSGDAGRLAAVLEREHLRLESAGPVRREADGLVAGIGRSEALQRALFALSEPGEVVPEPVLVEGTVWVARLAERERPDRATFDAERERFEVELHAMIRATAWDAFWSEQLSETPETFELPADYFGDKP